MEDNEEERQGGQREEFIVIRERESRGLTKRCDRWDQKEKSNKMC